MKVSVVAFVLTELVILVAGLWPFQFRPTNTVRQDGQAGLIFGRRGIAYVQNVRWRNLDDSGFTIETWLNSAAPITSRVGNIVYIAHDRPCSDFLLGQWRSALIVRASVRDDRGVIRHRELGIADCLNANQWRYVVITSGDRGTQVFVDGELRTQYSRRLLIEYSSGMLVFGNDPLGEAPWEGGILAVAIYSRTMEDAEVKQRSAIWKTTGIPPAPTQSAAWYDLPGLPKPSESHDAVPPPDTLYIPARFVPPRRAILSWDARLDQSGITDMILNLLGFLPVGFITSLAIKERASMKAALLWSVILGVALSAAIEVIQAYIPGRSSSSTDLLLNSVGTLVGAFLFVACARAILQNWNQTAPFAE
jgi:hypothetical protein